MTLAPPIVTTVTEIGILSRALLEASETMTPSAARFVLKIGFSEADRANASELTQRNQLGELSDGEHEELRAYANAGLVLARMHLRARKILRKLQVKPSRSSKHA